MEQAAQETTTSKRGRKRKCAEVADGVIPEERPTLHYFDDRTNHYTGLWVKYLTDPSLSPQEKEDIKTEVVVASQRIAKAVIRMNRLYQFMPEEDLLQEAALKVVRDFEKFKPEKDGETVVAKGKTSPAFNYLTTIIKHHLLTCIYKARKTSFHNTSLDTLMTTSQADTVASEGEVRAVAMGLQQSQPGTSEDVFSQFDLKAMSTILDKYPLGKEMLSFLQAEMDGTLEEKKHARKPTLKKLVKHLRNKGYPQSDIIEFMENVRKEYTIHRDVLHEPAEQVEEAAPAADGGTVDEAKVKRRGRKRKQRNTESGDPVDGSAKTKSRKDKRKH